MCAIFSIMTPHTIVALLLAAAMAFAPQQTPATPSEADRAAQLLASIKKTLSEPKGDVRNATLERMSDELDRLKDPATLAAKFSAHTSLNGYYRADDIDAGIIKHSTWLINTGKTLSPEQRKQYGQSIVSAYENMAEAHAGQGRNDEAIALLKRAPVEWPDVPNVAERTKPTLDRYLLVGTPAAAISAPRWINAPAGTSSIDMKGHVTLLEFTAHWCGPCRESYPGINRLRTRFESRGFRVVLATQLYGYFGTERPLDAAAEIERDQKYFAEHGMTVPVAVDDRSAGAARNNNDAAYKVGGIPQIHLVDKQGRIRLVMVGYDDANESKLAKMIEDLLKEK